MIPKIRNQTQGPETHQPCKKKIWMTIIILREVFKCLIGLTSANARGLFNYDLNDRTRNNGAKLIVKHSNTPVEQHIYPLKFTTTWKALP